VTGVLYEATCPALLAATTSLPELFTGFGATGLANLPDIALGDVARDEG
jgi:hypothetical protein